MGKFYTSKILLALENFIAIMDSGFPGVGSATFQRLEIIK
jgi:hypothetical protein